ncbi:MAG: sensor histidine kinase [Nannocystaceae bacterium]|nr:HAMP domain-containing histidine kinase [bacterium]
MPDRDPTSWPLRGPHSEGLRSVLLDHAADDAAVLGIAPDAYRAWLEGALECGPATASTRSGLAEAALNAASLTEQTEMLLRVGAARRRRASELETTRDLAAWTDAEMLLTVAAAQRLHDDPGTPRNRLATLGKAAGTLGHELRNPLGVIQSSVYLLGRKPLQDERARRHVDKIGRHAGVCHRIVEDLMHLARNAPPRLESLDIAEAFSLAIEEAALPPEVTCSVTVDAGTRVHADPGLLQRALVNLLRNANTAMRGRGALELGAAEGSNATELWVRDHGSGFPDALLAHAFDPLATTGGIGLGLALVESIMRRHRGSATATNEVEGGARVTLRFPRPD